MDNFPHLTALEVRVRGCLMEKQLLTPDVYPLTLNAVVAACNQKSNRDPVLELEPGAVGLGLQAFVRVQLARHDPPSIDHFVRRIGESAEVVACHALTGDMDYLLHVVVEDLDHFSRFLLDRLLNDSGVADVNSSFVLRTVKQTGALPLQA